MFMLKRHAGELEEREHLQPVAIVVGNPEQRGIGIERQHGTSISGQGRDNEKRPMKLRSSAFLHARRKNQNLQTPRFINPALTARAPSKLPTRLLTAV